MRCMGVVAGGQHRWWRWPLGVGLRAQACALPDRGECVGGGGVGATRGHAAAIIEVGVVAAVAATTAL